MHGLITGAYEVRRLLRIAGLIRIAVLAVLGAIVAVLVMVWGVP